MDNCQWTLDEAPGKVALECASLYSVPRAVGSCLRMDDQTRFLPLTQTLSAHCVEAGIQRPAIDVHENQDAPKTLVLTVSAEARSCFESLFYRVFLRPPTRSPAGYLIGQDEARQLVEREPYYDPCPRALTSPERIDADPPGS